MAQQGGGIPGPAVAMAAGGAFLLYIGVRDVSIRDGLKSVAGGQLPKGKTGGGTATAKASASLAGQGVPDTTTATSTTAGGSVGAGPHPELAAAAKAYLGVPYLWGGTDRKRGLDCSGLVYVSFQDAYGITPPRTTYTQVAWKKLTSITGDEIGAGDLLFWPRVGPPGHVGIAVDHSNVIHAPRPGKSVEIVPINQAYTAGMAPSPYRFTGG